MKNILLVVAITILCGCAVEPNGLIVPQDPYYGYAVPRVTVDGSLFYGQDYYFYGPHVQVVLPGMIYGRGWNGYGYYHSVPHRFYNNGHEQAWVYHGHVEGPHR